IKWVFYPGLVSGSGIPAPTIARDGTIYFGWWNEALYALNPDGTILWAHNVPDYSSVETSPVIGIDGTVYFNGSFGLHAMTADGTGKWSFPDNSSSTSEISIGQDGTIYAYNSNPNGLHAFAPDGT